MSVAFLITSLVVVATPGTGALFTISAGLTRGVRGGIVAAFGCTLGTLPHLAAAITGTAALLRASGLAFEIVKFAGVAYMIYLAWITWRDRTPLEFAPSETNRSAARVMASAVLANLLNPKLTLFFFAFLPQFVPSGGGQLPTMLALSAVFMAMTFVVFAAYAAFAAAAREHLIERPRVVRRIRQAFAVSFVGLGAKLATTAR